MKEKIIGLYQLITGVFGIILLVFNIQKTLASTSLIFLLIVGLSVHSDLLLRGARFHTIEILLSMGIKYSLILQGIQSVGFILGGIQYKFTCAAFLSLVFGSGDFFRFQISPLSYSISYAPDTSATMIIYVVPLIFILLLLPKKK